MKWVGSMKARCRSNTVRQRLSREWSLLLLALSFTTRLPLAENHVSSPDLEACRRYFSVAGAVIGAVMAAVYTLVSSGLPIPVAVMFALVAGLLLTGGLHEDGLADTFDGLGGGWSAVDKLTIMKDSRLGSYGALSLMASIGLRAVLLSALGSAAGWSGVCAALIVVHAASRAAAISVMACLPYARVENSRVAALSRPVASHDIVVVCLVAIVLALCLGGVVIAIMNVAVLGALVWGACRLLRAQLGGYTGDTLGAVQQCAEVALYTTWLYLCAS